MSPTTTSALKLRFLPPLTTLVTRLIDMTVSLRSKSAGSIFTRVLLMTVFSNPWHKSRCIRPVPHSG